MMVVGWLDVNGKVANNLVEAKLSLLFGVLKFKHDIKVISIATEVDGDPQHALQLLREYYQALSIVK